jgi:hypothetical protein
MGERTKLRKDIANLNLDLCDVELHTYLCDKSIPNVDKVKTIMPILSKKISQKVDLKGDVLGTLTLKWADNG